MSRIQRRTAAPREVQALVDSGVDPLLARIYCARGVAGRAELEYDLAGLLPPSGLKGADEAATLLADAIEAGARMLIVADYDCDGATACAVGLRALRAFGADVAYLVPNRFEYGYGLTPAIVDLAVPLQPELLITVDNGIASVDGVAAARAASMATLITDHHLPAEVLPDADVIVNPNQPGCPFESKSIAGVGVMFYVMLALRAELRSRNAFAERPEPNLASLLDLVALGTVADVVRLDRNNRILVSQGLRRMRTGRVQPGMRALFSVAGREVERATTFDLGFALGPRLNAAGRLADMSLGIECLATDDLPRALNIARELDSLNRERRAIEADMQADALIELDRLDVAGQASVALFEPTWHQGVIGILAGRIRERVHRPTIAFARSTDGELKGSGRSIDGVHLRDVLDLVSKRRPGLLLRFGGHAMAAGLAIAEADYPPFCEAFEAAVRAFVGDRPPEHTIDSDGPLDPGYMTLVSARRLEQEIWGQGFPGPVFDDVFEVDQQRLLKDRHLKLALRKGRTRFEAIRFNHAEAAPARIRAAYRLAVNEFNGRSTVQLLIDYFEPA
ncbi:MAG: single-stranded-DNA-specific exonuclease RecJ [Zoogloeaceae bacterium]|nr:single-stranded-DNA-specific exonuclease RecJ [Rhodocyclaceae bacterium]MCP5234419.1 single-stranded-DNA-specific exonuclease RecJ [Zoogloeaceae bacterium]